MNQTHKIFGNDNLRNSLRKCLNEGYFPATFNEIFNLIKLGEIENQGYDTSTISINGEIRDATLEELKNIEELYKRGGRIIFFTGSNPKNLVNTESSNFIGSSNINSNLAKFVGIINND